MGEYFYLMRNNLLSFYTIKAVKDKLYLYRKCRNFYRINHIIFLTFFGSYCIDTFDFFTKHNYIDPGIRYKNTCETEQIYFKKSPFGINCIYKSILRFFSIFDFSCVVGFIINTSFGC